MGKHFASGLLCMSAFGLAKQIDVSRTEAKQYIEAYFENYPNVLNYMDSTKELAKEKGFVETVMGRRLYNHFNIWVISANPRINI
jgi:DNA polymerase I-like protein with 3'-5' exonuclease and polymerase domains